MWTRRTHGNAGSSSPEVQPLWVSVTATSGTSSSKLSIRGHKAFNLEVFNCQAQDAVTELDSDLSCEPPFDLGSL